jgi:hypothetical protein
MRNIIWTILALYGLPIAIALFVVLLAVLEEPKTDVNVIGVFIFAIIGWIILGGYAFYRFIKHM